MNKTLALLLVASLLLAGCTELTESETDDETLNIVVNEDIAIEKIADFVTVDTSETFGIKMMYEMDPSMMDFGMGEVSDEDSEEDEEVKIMIEITEAWSPDGYYTSSSMGMAGENGSFTSTETITHVGTTVYIEVGMEVDGDVCEGDEMCEMMFSGANAPQPYSMTTTTTHTEVIAEMAEGSDWDDDDDSIMGLLQVFSFVECHGGFTPIDSVDGLQLFNVTFDDMDDDSLTPAMALCMADTDNSGSVSFEEFTVVDGTDQDDMVALQATFDEADANDNNELTEDELGAFIDAVDAYYGDNDDYDDDEGSDEMPSMAVAFNAAGEIEYFEMSMDEMGDEPLLMKMYVLTEDKVNAFFTDLDEGELVALPFSVSDSMYDDDWDDEYYDEYDYDDESYESNYNYYDYCTDEGQDYLECWDQEWDTDGDGDYEMSDGYWSWECEQLTDGSWECLGSDDDDSEMYYYCDRFIDLTTYEASSDDFETQYVDSFDSSLCGEPADEDASAEIDATVPTMPTSFVTESCDYDEENDMMDCEYETIEIIDNADTGVQEIYGTIDVPGEGYCGGDYDATTSKCTMYYGDVTGSDGNTIEIQWTWGVMFQCADGSDTIDLDWVNDGVADCSDGSDESSYDANGDDTMTFTCLDGSTIPLDYVLDDGDDCPGGEDEMPYMEFNFWFDYQYDASTGSGLMVYIEEDYDEDDFDGMGDDDDDFDGMGDDDEHVFYVTYEEDSVPYDFEGDMSDYKIELATCDYDYDMETGEEMNTCTTVMSVAIADAGEDSDIMFEDADSSGTLSVGDMIYVGETAEEWDTVRLYSISADAYSDENPLHDAPGFTGLVGILALLGAAFIRRNE